MISDLNIKLLAKITGFVLLIISAGMLPSMLVSFLFGETSMLLRFFTAALAVAVCGLALHAVRPPRTAMKSKDAFLTATVCWIAASLAGALPFLLAGIDCGPLDAIFESTSGFTAVGASIFTDVEILPKGLLFWRSSTIWFGGMGILIFAVAILPAFGIGSFQIAKAENTSLRMEKIEAKTSDTAKILYRFYVFITALEILLLMLCGMPLFDAFIHSFGTVGTGGFSNYNGNISAFGSASVHIVVMIFMFVGSLNFNWYDEILKGRWRSLLAVSELRFYICILLVFSAAVTIILFVTGTCGGLAESIKNGAFQVISTASTTGFYLTDFGSWPAPAKILLFMLFFMGGCTASTSGSLRALRILVVLKYIKREFDLKKHPKAVLPIKLNGRPVSEAALSSMLYLVATYVCVLAAGCILICLFERQSLTTSVSAVAGVLSSLGQGFDEIGPSAGYYIFSAPSKIVFIILMLLARLELFTMMILFTPSFWMANKRLR